MCIVLYLNRTAFQEWGNSRRGRPAAPIFERSWWCPRPWATEPARYCRTLQIAHRPPSRRPHRSVTALETLALEIHRLGDSCWLECNPLAANCCDFNLAAA